jgi:hypothetical protein
MLNNRIKDWDIKSIFNKEKDSKEYVSSIDGNKWKKIEIDVSIKIERSIL